ncbi:putative non-classical export protein 2 [Coleophoma crateriformis]|uniref:Putative non-classical export protein 2 n=1 Tax=Coleophoma crateriformis TaxID=565419 RepID=A0A3D8QLI2_9HELO|nr:putative non-classical export protein 2 [Coleophoma crateriformis]
MVAITQLGLRIFQFLMVLLITALVGNVIAEAFAGNASAINYAIFVAVFCWITVLYGLAAAVIESLTMPIVLAAADGLSALFTFIAGVVLAAKLGVHSCGNNSYVTSNSLTNGSNNPTKRCHELQASCAFFWFLFAAFCATAVLSFTGGSSSMRRGGLRKGGPSMSQV